MSLSVNNGLTLNRLSFIRTSILINIYGLVLKRLKKVFEILVGTDLISIFVETKDI